MKKSYFLLLLPLIFLQSNDFQQFIQQQKSSFERYKQTQTTDFEAYKKAYEEGLKEYKNDILEQWPQAELSTAHKWVQYDKTYETKKSVDFQNETIKLEVIANNEQEAREKLVESFNDLLKDDVQRAYSNDQLEQKVQAKLPKTVLTPTIKTKQKIVADVIEKKEQEAYVEVIKKEPLAKKAYKEKTIYTANLKLPSTALLKKARLYTHDVKAYAQKNSVNEELIFAVIHSESSFNPMARSHIPAYGLMQIVPKSAGVDVYNFLYKEKKILSSTYLYDPTNNIKIGSTYLHILYFNYLRHIKDETSRLYCSIAAYNTGAGNVARSFIGTTNIKEASKRINQLSAQEVYKHLMKNLPYNETRKYLQRVNERRYVYLKLLNEEQL